MGNIRVFVASNHPITRRGIALVIQEEAHDMDVIGQASDGVETIENILKTSPDVVVIDLEMSVASALETTTRVTKELPATAVLVLAGQNQQDQVMQTIGAGVSGFVLKNGEVEILLNAIRTVCLGAMFFAPGVDPKLVTEPSNGNNSGSFERLSPRERELFPLIAGCQSNAEVGAEVHLSPYTVQTYRQRIMKKLDIHKQVDLLKYGLRANLIQLDYDSASHPPQGVGPRIAEAAVASAKLA